MAKVFGFFFTVLPIVEIFASQKLAVCHICRIKRYVGSCSVTVKAFPINCSLAGVVARLSHNKES